MANETKPEMERELSEIRKEVIESRNLVIKTDHLLKNLHAELKLIGKRHEDFQTRQWVSSGVAYALFAGLCVAGAMWVSSSRVAAVGQDHQRLEKSLTEVTAQLDTLRDQQATKQTAERGAAEVYRQMTGLVGDQRLQGVDALAKLDQSKLSALERQALNDKADALRKEIGQAAFERGKAAFRRNDMQATMLELSRFVAMNPTDSDLLEASYFLGAAYSLARKHEQAIPLLERSVQGDRRAKTRDHAMLLLANSYEATGQLDKAADLVRDAIGSYPASDFQLALRARLTSVKRLQAAAAASGANVAAPSVTGAPPPGSPSVAQAPQAVAPAPMQAPPAGAAPAQAPVPPANAPAPVAANPQAR